MSTRCNIILQDDRGNKKALYHHCDGYPEGVGKELRKIINTSGDNCFEYNNLLQTILDYDSEYEDDGAWIHGDIDYLYTITIETDKSCLLVCNEYYDGLGDKVFEFKRNKE